MTSITMNVKFSRVSAEAHEHLECYQDWRQIAGYFDGDGCVDFDSGKWVLFPKFTFTDNYFPLIEMLKTFLVSHGIQTQDVSFFMGAWRLGVAQSTSLLRMAVMMWPHCSKKRAEVKTFIDYLQNRITGSDFVQVLNESVRSGNRTGKIRTASIPYTREQGQVLRKQEVVEQAKMMGCGNRVLSDDLANEIRIAFASGRFSQGKLALMYGVGDSTISRTIWGRKERRHDTYRFDREDQHW
jgi:hypothetical protein